MTTVIAQHESNPLFASFVETLSKDLCESLTAAQTRKVASSLSVVGNTKQQEERDKASGKKKVSASLREWSRCGWPWKAGWRNRCGVVGAGWRSWRDGMRRPWALCVV
jgi:hypothetical protein